MRERERDREGERKAVWGYVRLCGARWMDGGD